MLIIEGLLSANGSSFAFLNDFSHSLGKKIKDIFGYIE
jgi:hypothetical protein